MVSARSIILAGATCLMLGGAAPATAAETIAATTASDGVIQVTGTSLADTVTVLRREGTRFVRITGNRPVTAGTGCQALSSTQVECVPPPVGLNPIQPSLGIIFFGTPVLIRVTLGDGADTLTFLRSGLSTLADSTGLTVFGGDGDDRLSAAGLQSGATGSGNGSPVLMFGGDGDDVIAGGAGDDRLIGDGGDDILVGGVGDDRLLGSGGDDVLSGGQASDVLIGGVGGDVLSGGTDGTADDRDEVQFQEFTPDPPFPSTTFTAVPRAGIQVGVGDGVCLDGGPEDLATGPRPRSPVATSCGRTANGVERDEVLGDVEIVSGTEVSDIVVGGPASETILGNGGSDQLEGGPGSDNLIGGAGSDALLLRDDLADAGALCGEGRDRALVDKLDPVDPSCELVDRGGSGAQGPVGGVVVTPPPPPAPDDPAPAPAPDPGTVATEVTIVVPGATPDDPITEQQVVVDQPAPAGAAPTGVPTGGPGPGGGDGGRKPPEARIVSSALSIDRRGRAAVLITCTYRAEACAGTATLTTAATVGRGRSRVGRGVRVSRTRVKIPWGRTEVVRLPVDRRFRRALGSRRTRLVLRLEVRDASAAPAAATLRLRRTVTVARARG